MVGVGAIPKEVPTFAEVVAKKRPHSPELKYQVGTVCNDGGNLNNRYWESTEKFGANDSTGGENDNTSDSRRTLALCSTFSYHKVFRNLGKGSFGTVVLSRTREPLDNGEETVAIKMIPKSPKTLRHIHNERDVLKSITNHPFVIDLVACTQNMSHAFFVTKFVDGYDLGFVMGFFSVPETDFMSPQLARLYIAQIVLALEHLHGLGVIHRDIKKSNVMVGRDGYIKLLDFGLSLRDETLIRNPLANVSSHQCGTNGYKSPQVLEGKPYGVATDWWSLGVLAHMMLIGKRPFHHNARTFIEPIVAPNAPHYPEWITSKEVSFLNGLLRRSESKRLRKAEVVKGHRYFHGVEWDRLLAKKIPFPTPHATMRLRVQVEEIKKGSLFRHDKKGKMDLSLDQYSQALAAMSHIKPVYLRGFEYANPRYVEVVEAA